MRKNIERLFQRVKEIEKIIYGGIRLEKKLAQLEKMNDKIRKKILKISLTIIIIISILFVAMMWILTYHEEGETNLPFKISKIVIVSSTDGVQNDSSQTQWAMDVNQNNDIYLYIDKNSNYGKTELIENVKISNFNIIKETNKGEIKIYKTTIDEDKMFNNTKEFEINELTYEGDLESNIKQSKISNQGGLIVFRCANNKVSQYISTDATEVNYNELLKMTNVSEEDLNVSISFDIEIKIVNRKTYQATISLDLPVEDVITNGTANVEITDLEDIVFKII